MTKAPSQVIDEDAVQLLTQTLPKANWQTYRVDPDRGKDFFLELVDQTVFTGEMCIVQLKGKAKGLSAKGGHVKFPLETKYLKYFRQLRDPVFLIVADLRNETLYWLFVQRYIAERLPRTNWERQKSVTLEIPETQRVENLSQFRKSVQEAINYMGGLFPLCLDSAIKAKKLQLERLDPRFKVDVDVKQGQPQYILHAQTPYNGAFEFVGPPEVANQKLLDLIERGLPIDVAPGELRIKGLPILEAVAKDIRRIEANRKVSGLANLIRTSATGSSTGRFGLPCTIVCGTREVRAEITSPDGVMSLTVTLQHDSDDRMPASWQFDISKWAGTPVLDIKWFDEWRNLLTEISEADALKIELNLPDRAPYSAQLFVSAQQLSEVSEVLHLIDRARIGARAFAVNPNLPHRLTATDVGDIDLLYDLATSGNASRNGRCTKVSLTFSRESMLGILNTPADKANENSMTLREPHRWRILGVQVDLTGFEIQVTNVALATPRSTLRRKVRDRNCDMIKVSWRGTDNTRFTITRCAA